MLRSYGWGKETGKIFIAQLREGNHQLLSDLPSGANLGFREGTLVSISDTSMIYAIEAGKRRPFQSEDAFRALGYTRSQVLIVTRIRWPGFPRAPRSH